MASSLRNYCANEGAKWLVLATWLAINAGLFYSTFFYYYYGPQFYYLHQMLGYGLCLSRASAACINLNACIILLPMCRIVLRLIRSFSKVCRQCRRILDKSKSFHIACGYMICAMSALHCGAHAFNAFNFHAYFNFRFPSINVATSAEQSPIMIVLTSVPGVTGLLMVLCLLIIAITASSPIRRASYRRFWKIHHLFLAFYVLLLLHACSGVLKYQTNTEEHIPGCYIDLNAKGNMTNKTMILPEPEAEPHPGHTVISEPLPESANLHKAMPEAEPEIMHVDFHIDPEGEPGIAGGGHHPIPEGEPTTYLQSCIQPNPRFSACPTEAWMWLSVPLLLYALERISRFVGSSGQPLEITRVHEHPNDVIEVEFYQKDFKAKPGQSIWLRCPEISFVECHPFTLTSIPTRDRPVFTIHMQVLGNWTTRAKELLLRAVSASKRRQQLYEESVLETLPRTSNNDNSPYHRAEQLQTLQSPEHSRLDQAYASNDSIHIEKSTTESDPHQRQSRVGGQPKFFAHGPHGSAMEDIFRYEVSLCVAGGIGITPFAALLSIILNRSEVVEKSKLKRIYLVWACKTFNTFEWFVGLLNSVQQHLWEANKPDFLNVYLHVTGESDGEKDDLCSHQSLERFRLRRGRPDLKEMFNDLSRRHQRTTVGVFCCGPKRLSSAVRGQCFKSKGKNVSFMFNKESF